MTWVVLGAHAMVHKISSEILTGHIASDGQCFEGGAGGATLQLWLAPAASSQKSGVLFTTLVSFVRSIVELDKGLTALSSKV